MKNALCCLCHDPVASSGWCENCRTWPINITPLRYDERGHCVAITGWCAQCGLYVLTELDAQPGEWVDTGRKSRKVTQDEIHAMTESITRRLSGPGWPDVEVALRKDDIPRRWKHALLRKVGMTPMGYEVVIPDRQETVAGMVDEVPF